MKALSLGLLLLQALSAADAQGPPPKGQQGSDGGGLPSRPNGGAPPTAPNQNNGLPMNLPVIAINPQNPNSPPTPNRPRAPSGPRTPSRLPRSPWGSQYPDDENEDWSPDDQQKKGPKKSKGAGPYDPCAVCEYDDYDKDKDDVNDHRRLLKFDDLHGRDAWGIKRSPRPQEEVQPQAKGDGPELTGFVFPQPKGKIQQPSNADPSDDFGSPGGPFDDNENPWYVKKWKKSKSDKPRCPPWCKQPPRPTSTLPPINKVCPATCYPPNGLNTCDLSAGCASAGGTKYYCVCPAGFRATGYVPSDFTHQFKVPGLPYVYVAPGVQCGTLCGPYDQDCSGSGVLTRAQCV
ncbi:hypothetical protein BCR34DRAFT_595597 [Clohesyomyces aquaticus]|uniref:EGF-like domain-containing protein n=1 Tax=Clohesyomyces aquaticus TaxID=1231657 RepID=A0A1Y2A9K5_9PLEO|nr:hypothetical protein BCR34DRAFT_595597 [Clohesyomyces aquaticus]